jgi:hypothetical protein
MLIFEILHVIGVVLGFGGAAVSCAIMLYVRTDEKRLHRGRIARRICIATWTGLVLLIISGIALTVGYNNGYNIVLAVKHLFVAIIVVDAFIIHFLLFPHYFRQIGTPDFDMTYSTMKWIGMLSMSCWIFTFILSVFLGG